MQRFVQAAKHALAEGDFKLAAKRLVFARDAEPHNVQVLRLMTTAFWQAGDYSAAARCVRDWARVEPERPAPWRTAARIYEDMGSLSQATDAAERETAAAPRDATAWERLGRLRMRRFDRAGARDALERARVLRPSVEGLLDLATIAHLAGDVGAGGLRLRAGDGGRPRAPRRLVALRPRPGPHRPHPGLPRRLRPRARARRRPRGPRAGGVGPRAGPARAGRLVVTVVGAGMAGAACAVALRDGGWRCGSSTAAARRAGG